MYVYINLIKSGTNRALENVHELHGVHYKQNAVLAGSGARANSPSGNTQLRPRYSHTCCLQSPAYTHLDLHQTTGTEEEVTKGLYITKHSATTAQCPTYSI